MATWKPVVGYEDRYEVSSAGKIRALNWRRTGIVKELKPTLDTSGYMSVTLYGVGPRKSRNVHSIVASAFLGVRPRGFEINHKDGKKENNGKRNLEYLPPIENKHHAIRLGLMNHVVGENAGVAKLNEEKVTEILARASAGERKPCIAKHFKVHLSTIQKIVAGEAWRHCQKGG